MSTSMSKSIQFIDSKAVQARPEFYMRVELNVAEILKNWQLSVFSYEWMEKDGSLKANADLKESDQSKQNDILETLQKNNSVDIPVLGIGIQDNVEIGSGKAVLCTLATQGIQTIPAHIPKSNESDFQNFQADIK